MEAKNVRRKFIIFIASFTRKSFKEAEKKRDDFFSVKVECDIMGLFVSDATRSISTIYRIQTSLLANPKNMKIERKISTVFGQSVKNQINHLGVRSNGNYEQKKRVLFFWLEFIDFLGILEESSFLENIFQSI